MSWRTQFVTISIAVVLVIGFGRAGYLDGPRNVLATVLNPFQVGWYRLGQITSEKFGLITQIGTLSSDNFRLREDYDKLKSELAGLEAVQKDNLILRQQLGSSETRGFQLIAAQTLGFVPAIGTKELLLSVGSSGGAKIGQAVVNGKVVLGRISSVQSDRSTLRLLTDPQSRVVVSTLTGARGILVGQFQSSSKLTKVLQDEKLNVGDVVFTSGEDDWPVRLVIGEIIKVVKRDNELFQEAEVRPLVNYDKLQVVFIITGYK